MVEVPPHCTSRAVYWHKEHRIGCNTIIMSDMAGVMWLESSRVTQEGCKGPG